MALELLYDVPVVVVGKLGRDGIASFRLWFCFVAVGFVLVLLAGKEA